MLFVETLLTQWGRRFVNERTAKFISLAAGIALILFGLRFGYNGFCAALGG